jgi:hypothetical protein
MRPARPAAQVAGGLEWRMARGGAKGGGARSGYLVKADSFPTQQNLGGFVGRWLVTTAFFHSHPLPSQLVYGWRAADHAMTAGCFQVSPDNVNAELLPPLEPRLPPGFTDLVFDHTQPFDQCGESGSPANRAPAPSHVKR